MTYIGDVIKNQMQKLQITKEMILEHTIIEDDELDLLIENRIPAEIVLYHDMSSLCEYLKIA